ncbi:MAG: glutathione S-transferase family protein [Pseudomonadota bacterium]
MILYGRNLSPFVRRVHLWLALQRRAFEQQGLAATEPADAEAIRAVNPIRRVPALVLEDGTTLTECFAICDWLDETGGPRLIPAAGIARREALGRIAVASATSDKAVAMVYERNRRPEAFHYPDWQARLSDQIQEGLALVEASVPETGWMGDRWRGGEGPDGGDLAAVCLHDFLAVTNPWLLEPGYPRLVALAARANAASPFAASHPG